MLIPLFFFLGDINYIKQSWVICLITKNCMLCSSYNHLLLQSPLYSSQGRVPISWFVIVQSHSGITDFMVSFINSHQSPPSLQSLFIFYFFFGGVVYGNSGTVCFVFLFCFYVSWDSESWGFGFCFVTCVWPVWALRKTGQKEKKRKFLTFYVFCCLVYENPTRLTWTKWIYFLIYFYLGN